MIALLEASGIRKKFGTREVLRGLGLTAGRGDVISMIGASGSGKSTFLRCLNFLEHPTEGQIAFAGDALTCKRDRLGDLVVADPRGAVAVVAEGAGLPVHARSPSWSGLAV